MIVNLLWTTQSWIDIYFQLLDLKSEQAPVVLSLNASLILLQDIRALVKKRKKIVKYYVKNMNGAEVYEHHILERNVVYWQMTAHQSMDLIIIILEDGQSQKTGRRANIHFIIV